MNPTKFIIRIEFETGPKTSYIPCSDAIAVSDMLGRLTAPEEAHKPQRACLWVVEPRALLPGELLSYGIDSRGIPVVAPEEMK